MKKTWAPDDPRWDKLDAWIAKGQAEGAFDHLTDDWLDQIRGHVNARQNIGKITLSGGMGGGHRCPGCKGVNTMSISEYYIRLTADDIPEVNYELYCRECRTREITPPYEVVIEYDEDETR